MQRSAMSKIVLLPCERLALGRNLHKGWQWLKYTGLHPDLLLISVNQHRFSEIIRYCFTLLILLLIAAYDVFELYQLVNKTWSVDKMVEVVPNILFSFFYLETLVCEFAMWSRRHQFMELFNDWKIVEMQSKCYCLGEAKRIINVIHMWMVAYTITGTFLIFMWNMMEPQRSYFLSHYPVVYDSFGLLLISAVNTFIFSYVLIMFCWVSLIPAIFFYHVSFLVENLVEEWECSVRNRESNRLIWVKYEKILHLVQRANGLFGTLLTVQHFYQVFGFCLIIYYAMEQSQESPGTFLILVVYLIYFACQVIGINWMLSQLYFSTNKLDKSIADYLSREWYQLGEAERHLFVSFQTRLDRGDMSVRPMNLFTVCPSNLLSMFAVVLNYLIVLAQSR